MISYSFIVTLVWNIAAHEAKNSCSAEIEPEHLLLGFLKLGDIDLDEVITKIEPDEALDRKNIEDEISGLISLYNHAGIDPTMVRRRFRKLILQPAGHPQNQVTWHRSSSSRKVFERAEDIARQKGCSPLPSKLLLLTVLEALDPALSPQVTETGLAKLIPLIKTDYGLPSSTPKEDHPQKKAEKPTPMLDLFGRDLTAMARLGKLDPLVGRKEEMRILGQVLLQKRKNNPLLLGDPGVGKTCIVEGLAQKIVDGNAPPDLAGKRIIELSMAGLLAGASYRGQFEERLKGVISETAQNEEIILFIDEIHTAIEAGGDGASNAANILKPALARGEIRCIGATTIAEYRKYIEKDAAFERRFQVVWVDEPTREEAIEILQGLKPKFEQYHEMKISDEAIQAAVELSQRYMIGFFLPDKAIDLIDRACAAARLVSFSPDKPQTTFTIQRKEIAISVAKRCRIPVDRLTEDEAARLLKMEEYLCQRVIGQDEAIHAVAEAIRTARAGLKPPKRPVGVFLFAGSTGTGKTELAKALAEFLFEDEESLIRIDMSEYMEKHSVSRLVGAPPGYVGYDEEGQLSGPVRTHPYSVVLFDEIEKAHPDVLNIMLQIFDDGRFTDARGRRVSFSETVIIMTSNLGGAATPPSEGAISLLELGASHLFLAGMQFSREKYQGQIMEAIRSNLRSELVNRISNIVFFYPLSREDVRQIIHKILKLTQKQLEERKITIEVSEDACDLLMDEGFSPTYGAREMERAVQRLIVQPLGKAILSGQIIAGSNVMVNAQNGAIIFQ